MPKIVGRIVVNDSESKDVAVEFEVDNTDGADEIIIKTAEDQGDIYLVFRYKKDNK